jgi:hypothetical protein
VAAGYAWSLCAILVGGYHCNTDTIYAFFCLLSVYYLEERRAWLAGGLALAAAVNVKLTPVLLVPVLLLSARRWPDALRFVGGLAVGVVPFVPVLVLAGDKFYANAIRYGSNPDNWGVTYLLMLATGGPPADAGNATVGDSAGRRVLLRARPAPAAGGRGRVGGGRASARRPRAGQPVRPRGGHAGPVPRAGPGVRAAVHGRRAAAAVRVPAAVGGVVRAGGRGVSADQLLGPVAGEGVAAELAVPGKIPVAVAAVGPGGVGAARRVRDPAR